MTSPIGLKTRVVGMVIALIALCGFLLWTPDRARPLLEERYLAAPSDMVDVAGVRLHVRDSGPKDAPAIVLLHGFASSLHTWEAWSHVLEADHRVIRFDLPGSGLSPQDPSGDYTDARSIQLLIALLDQKGVARTSVIGNSIGGRIAWTFAATHPDRVDRLVLVSPDGFASPGFQYGKPPHVPVAFRLMRYVLPKPLVRMSIAPAYADPAALTEQTLDRYDDLLRAPGARDAMLARMAQTVLTDPVPLLRRIQAPTLLVWGERDGMIPFANSADYLREIPDVRLVALPGVGHLPQEEAPVASVAPVRAFLSPANTGR